MFKMSGLSMVFNIAGAAAVLVVGSYAVHSFFTMEKTPSCTGRYPASTQLSLTSGRGVPMTPMELQGRFGREEWGVLENVEIVRGKQNGSEVLQVKLPAGSSSAFQAGAPKGGAGFSWSPENMQDATGACLSYRVMLPPDFDFAEAGLLPGLFGGEALDPESSNDGKSGFATRISWGAQGAGSIASLVPASLGTNPRQFDEGNFKFDTGRWVHLASEVVLNSPGASDGILRLWVDGELRIERNDYLWRDAGELNISGVVADISYGGIDTKAVAPKDTKVQFSPFELSWR